MVVMKFGGTSVADAAALERLRRLVRRRRAADGGRRRPAPNAGPIVVVSAQAGVTNQLLDAARAAERGEVAVAVGIADAIERRSIETASALVQEGDARASLSADLRRWSAELSDMLRALSVLGYVAPRSLDAVAAFGELLSSRITAAALAGAGLPAVWIDARRVIVTDGVFTAANPLFDETAARLTQEVGPALARGETPVVGGFIAATREGVTTTLGRGGSDYSAAIIGAALGAAEIQIWTDVDGMLTADPRVVPHASVAPHLSFDEAAELAFFGAKVLHPGTMRPAAALNIPIRILNAARPQASGTLVSSDPPARPGALTALACKRGVVVVDVTLPRMAVEYGWLRRLFEVFERFRTPVDVVTTSETSVSLTIDDSSRLDEITDAIGRFADVSSERGWSILCAVGDNVRIDPAVPVRVLRALDGVAVRMLSQASSRRNITMVLREADLATAMTDLHRAFFEQPAARPQRAPRKAARSTGRRRIAAGSTEA
jgi:aspartate kinase